MDCAVNTDSNFIDNTAHENNTDHENVWYQSLMDSKHIQASKLQQSRLVDGYIRIIESCLDNKQIIPNSICIICFQFYYISMYITTINGVEAISLGNKRRWKCDIDTVNTLAYSEMSEEVMRMLEQGTVLVKY